MCGSCLSKYQSLTSFLVIQQAFFNLTQRQRQWLLAWFRGDQWTDEFKYAFVLFLIVAIDLTCPFSGEDHQSVLRRHFIQQFVDWWIRDAFGFIEDAVSFRGLGSHYETNPFSR